MFRYVGSYSLQLFRRSTPSYPGQGLGSMIGVDHSSHKYSTFCHHASPAFHMKARKDEYMRGLVLHSHPWVALFQIPLPLMQRWLPTHSSPTLDTHPGSLRVPTDDHDQPYPVFRTDREEARGPIVPRKGHEGKSHE